MRCSTCLYSRFWHKVLFDRGLVSTVEPFQKLVNQGMILGEVEYTGFQDDSGRWVSGTLVEPDAQGYAIVEDGARRPAQAVRLREDQVTKKGEGFVLADGRRDPGAARGPTRCPRAGRT